MIRAITFDVGGTLIHPHPSVGTIYARAGRRFGLRATPAALDDAFRRIWSGRHRDGREHQDGRRWWRRLVFGVFDAVGYTGERAECFEACYKAFARADAWRLFDDVRPALDRLRSCEIPLGVISNWDERLPTLLEELNLAPYFDWVLVSALEGIHKPDPRLFERACQRAGRSPAEMLHVGDDPEEDIAAAHQAGLAAVLIDRSDRFEQDDSIRDLEEIVTMATRSLDQPADGSNG